MKYIVLSILIIIFYLLFFNIGIVIGTKMIKRSNKDELNESYARGFNDCKEYYKELDEKIKRIKSILCDDDKLE